MGDAGNDPRLQQLRALRARVRQGGGAERIARQHAKGKLTPVSGSICCWTPAPLTSLSLLLSVTTTPDPQGGALLRLGRELARSGGREVPGRRGDHRLWPDSTAGQCNVYAQDFTILGGTLSEMQSRKSLPGDGPGRAQRAPIVGLIDSGGARIQEGVRSLGGYAEIFKRNSQYSGRCSQISIMLARAPRGASYCPALTDLIIMVEKQSFMFITGPEVIKSVTGELIDQESWAERCAHGAQRHSPPGIQNRAGGAGLVPAAARLFTLQQRRQPTLRAVRR